MRIKTGKDLRLALLSYFEELRLKELKIYRITIFIIILIALLAIAVGIENIQGEISITSVIMNSIGAIALCSVAILMLSLLILTENEKFGFFIEYKICKSLYKKIHNTEKIIRDGVCNFTINYEEKYYIVEFFTHSKNLVHNIDIPKYLIEDALSKLLPNSSNFEKHILVNGLQPTYIESNYTLDDKIEKLIESEIASKVKYLDEDVRDKGIEMSKVYYYLYCLENSIREFIDYRSKLKYGKNYSGHIFISRSIKKKIEQRTENEAKYKYISFRGKNFLFYLDFKELGDIIVNNPYLLESFPDEIWVKAKINEMGNIRNLIAHNSYVGKHELEIIKITFQSILMQFDK